MDGIKEQFKSDQELVANHPNLENLDSASTFEGNLPPDLPIPLKENENPIKVLEQVTRRQLSPHEQKKMEENLQQLLHINQRTAELNSLIREENFSKLRKKPWEINVVKTIEDFQNRIYDNPEIKFRIGGRIIHSASRLVNVKSRSIIQRSHETQEEIQKMDEDPSASLEGDMDDPNRETMADVLGDFMDVDFYQSNQASGSGNSEQMNNYLRERDAELRQHVNMQPFYNEDRTGQRFLSAPIRKVFRKIDFEDLGNALSKSLNNQLRRTLIDKKSRRKIKLDATGILPEHLLKKTEEDRALVEKQISMLFDRITTQFIKTPDPISFISLILTPDPDGIVRTLLYLLQLVNRKKIDIWQQVDEEDPAESSFADGNVDLDIFVSPRANEPKSKGINKKKKTTNESERKKNKK